MLKTLAPQLCSVQNGRKGSPGVKQKDFKVNTLSSPRTCGHCPEQNVFTESQNQRGGPEPRGPVENVGPTAQDTPGEAARLQHARESPGGVR